MAKIARIKKYSKGAYAVRFKIHVEKALLKYIAKHPETSKSDIIQNAVECWLFNKKCLAKRRLI
ncbi:MAG: hypothetical protein WC569_02290 [Candidatus Omnitrophota bacterium]